MYKDFRQERIQIFEETRQFYETNERLAESIVFSKKKQEVIADDIEIAATEAGYDSPAEVLVSRKRTLEAAGQYAGQKVCVLNFASATNAGGGVTKGASAQEEAICRCSTLYPCISDGSVTNLFHQKHRNAIREGRMSSLYNDDCIFTPGVVVFKSDIDHPTLLAEHCWYQVDVISCAAPNLRRNPSNAMNPGSGNEMPVIKADALLELHKKRIKRILAIASLHEAEIMILGAFGCGAFHNPPDVVAAAMREAVRDYLYHFKTMEFAVYCPPGNTKNYDVFQKRLSCSLD